MFAPTRYLNWARRFYGRVRFDLATSGIPTAPLADWGMPSGAALDDPTGWERLREAIAAHNDVPSSEAVAALGTAHALWLAYASLAGPGDDILVEDPAYEPLLRAAEGVGARVLRFSRDAQDGFALDPERVAHALTPRTRVVALTNLHNPTGVRADEGALRATAQLLESRGASLLVDEVYAAFDDLVDAHGVFRGSARKLASNVVAVSSLTKCHGLGPHRVGWVLAPPEVIARVEDTITATSGMLPLAHAHTGVLAFSRILELAGRAKSLLAGKRERVGAWVDSQGLLWSAPAAGLFAFVTVPGAADLTPCVEATVRQREVLVAPGAFFGVPNGFRIAWSAPSPLLEEGLGRLAECLPGWR
jgi:aspartate/methionine/tyrosine aminotransferase